MDTLTAFQNAARELQPLLAENASKYYSADPPAHDSIELHFSCGGSADIHMSLLCQLSPVLRAREAFKKEPVSMSLADFRQLQNLWVCLLSPQQLPTIQGAPALRVLKLLLAADYCQMCAPVLNYLTQDVQKRLGVAGCVAVAKDAFLPHMPDYVLHLVLPTLLECPASLGGEHGVVNQQLKLELHLKRAHMMPNGLHWLNCQKSMFHRPVYEFLIENGALCLKEKLDFQPQKEIEVHAMVSLNAHCVVLHASYSLPGEYRKGRLICMDTRTGTMVGQPRLAKFCSKDSTLVANDAHLFVDEGHQITVFPRDEAVFTSDMLHWTQVLEFTKGLVRMEAFNEPSSDSLVLWCSDTPGLVVYRRNPRDEKYSRRYGMYSRRYRIPVEGQSGCPEQKRVHSGLWLSDTRLLLAITGAADYTSLQLFDEGRPVGEPYPVGRCRVEKHGLRHLLGRIYFARNEITYPKPDPADGQDYDSGIWVFDAVTLTRLLTVPYPDSYVKGCMYVHETRLLVVLNLTKHYLFDPAINSLLPGHMDLCTFRGLVTLSSGAIVIVDENGEISVMTRME
jgi:hypothetical protein